MIKFRGQPLNDDYYVYGGLICDNAQCRIVFNIVNYNSKMCECGSIEVRKETVEQFICFENGIEKYKKIGER